MRLPPNADEIALLDQTSRQSERLLTVLLDRRADLARSSSSVSPEVRAEGDAALARAADAATRLLQVLRNDSDSSSETDHDH